MKMVYVLFAAVAAGAIAAGAHSVAGSPPSPPAADPPSEAPARAPIAAEPPVPEDESSGTNEDPHAAMRGASKPTVEVKPVAKAKGPEGRTVAELIAQREKLAGKMVRLHATVVKATPGVLGKTYLHVRDGSGSDGTNDVSVTTTATPSVGDTILLEGTVVLDRDIGAGYKFPTLVEDAKILPQ